MRGRSRSVRLCVIPVVIWSEKSGFCLRHRQIRRPVPVNFLQLSHVIRHTEQYRGRRRTESRAKSKRNDFERSELLNSALS